MGLRQGQKGRGNEKDACGSKDPPILLFPVSSARLHQSVESERRRSTSIAVRRRGWILLKSLVPSRTVSRLEILKAVQSQRLVSKQLRDRCRVPQQKMRREFLGGRIFPRAVSTESKIKGESARRRVSQVEEGRCKNVRHGVVE